MKVIRKLSAVAAAAALAGAGAGHAQAGSGNIPQGFTAQEWNAIQLRSEALNQKYHLGAYSTAGDSAQAERAIMLRSQALDRKYHLGRYALASTSRQSNDFDWGDAGIGSAATLGLVLTGIAVAVGTRRVRGVRHRPVV
jgi:hypothetical protein